MPLNHLAKSSLPQRVTMTERQWVAFLYRLRGYEAPPELLDGIGVEI